MLDTLLQSEWLIRMLDKSGKSPTHKLLALFDVLEDALSSPLTFVPTLKPIASDKPSLKSVTANRTDYLQKYLYTQAQLAGAKLPEMLANQLYFMAVSACQDKLAQPYSTALQHAKRAAQALVQEQTSREWPWQATRNYAIALSALFLGLWGGYKLSFLSIQSPSATPSFASEEPPPHPLSQEASPSETAAIYARLETMRYGDCRLIEAIQLPERLKSIYIENIINGHVTTRRDEQILVNQLLDQVKCNYTPKLMQNSK